MPCPPDAQEKRYITADWGYRQVRPAVESQRAELADAARLLRGWMKEYAEFPAECVPEAASLANQAEALPPLPLPFEPTTWPGDPEAEEQGRRLAALRTLHRREEVLLCELRTLMCRVALGSGIHFWTDDEIGWEHHLAAHRIHRHEDREAILRHLAQALAEADNPAEAHRIQLQMARIRSLTEHQLLTVREFV
jgi:hypothetical protein